MVFLSYRNVRKVVACDLQVLKYHALKIMHDHFLCRSFQEAFMSYNTINRSCIELVNLGCTGCICGDCVFCCVLDGGRYVLAWSRGSSDD